MSAERRHARRSAGGFTLLEALVAIAVLALVAGAALPILAGGLRSLSVSEEYVNGVQLAQFLLDEAAFLGPGERIDEGVSAEGLRWRRTIRAPAWWQPAARREPAVHPLEVEVEVNWESGGAERHIALRSVRPARRSP